MAVHVPSIHTTGTTSINGTVVYDSASGFCQIAKKRNRSAQDVMEDQGPRLGTR